MAVPAARAVVSAPGGRPGAGQCPLSEHRQYEAVPRVTYPDPQAGAVGVTEDRYSATTPLSEVPKTATYTHAYAESTGFLTLLSDGERLTGAYAVGPEAERPEPWPYQQPTWVFTTRTLPPVPGADIRFVRGDVRPVHREMAQAAKGKNVWLVGGGELVGQFYDAGLLDELIVQVGWVTLGRGKPLLPRRITSPSLKLISVTQVGTGFAELRYEVPRPPGADERFN